MVSNDRIKLIDGLIVLKNVVAACSFLRRFIQPALLVNWAQKLAIPLWVAHAIHIQGTKADCRQVLQRKLQEDGVEKLEDILDKNGKFREWEEIQHQFLLPNCQSAYKKLISNLDLSKSRVVDSAKFTLLYTHKGRL